jgi:hypothetical protein
VIFLYIFFDLFRPFLCFLCTFFCVFLLVAPWFLLLLALLYFCFFSLCLSCVIHRSCFEVIIINSLPVIHVNSQFLQEERSIAPFFERMSTSNQAESSESFLRIGLHGSGEALRLSSLSSVFDSSEVAGLSLYSYLHSVSTTTFSSNTTAPFACFLCLCYFYCTSSCFFCYCFVCLYYFCFKIAAIWFLF